MAAELDFFRRTGLHPPMHLIAVKRPIVEANAWLPMALYRAFAEAQATAQARLHDSDTLGTMLPWAVQHMEMTERELGCEFWPTGFAKNRDTLATLIRYTRAEGALTRDLVPEALATAEPEVVRALVRITVQGISDVLADPVAAIAAVRAREALADPALEDERMRFIFCEAVLTPAVAANGVGHVDPAKAQSMMQIAARAFGVPAAPDWQRVMRTDFLPLTAARMLPAMRA